MHFKFFFLYLFFGSFVFAQSGKVFDNLNMQSKILNGERKYAVYLPPDYESSERRYPVLYLLHGMGDDQAAWIQFGEVLHIADKAINEGKATPMIIVMPDADQARKGYGNNIRGEWQYEDFFFEEFIPFIEKTYRIKSEKRYRAVSGLSMGGEGTFLFALKHPGMFSSACPLSAATGPLNSDDAKLRLSWNYKNVTEEEINEFINSTSVLKLIEAVQEQNKKDVRWYIDCGDDDFLFEGNSLVHILMRKKGIPHEFRIREGGHTWTYWRSALPEVLEFISKGFHQY